MERGDVTQVTDWDNIRYFLAVARAGTIRGAAEVLAVNPSTVLRRIDQLEARLDMPLFERHVSGYSLRDVALRIFDIAEAVERLAEEFKSRAQSVK